MPALTKEELEARKRARNSRIVEKSLDRMAIIQETTIDRVNMPEEYYQRQNTDNQKKRTMEPTANSCNPNALRGLDFSAMPDLSALQQALAEGNIGQLLSSLLGSALGASGNAKQARSTKNAKKAKLLLQCMNVVFLFLTVFSALVKVCIANYETFSTIRWISKYSVVPIFMFFHTIQEANDLPHVKFKCGLSKLLVLAAVTYCGLLFKVLSMPIIQSFSVCTRALLRTFLVHIAIYLGIWCAAYIGDRLLL